MVVFWVVTPCELVGGYQRFGATYCLLKMEEVCCSETLVPTYKSPRRYDPEDHLGHLRRKNIRSDIIYPKFVDIFIVSQRDRFHTYIYCFHEL
jgi:hypothetical protein